MNKSELHLFIIWQKGRYKEPEILNDIAKNFTLLRKYAITWNPELVSSNFTRFYGVNLPPNSGKEIECGTGEFLLCVVRDENPIYDERLTSHGLEIVNVNMFDAEDRYRAWTGGGHKIHGTNSEKETNHDLTLLIGKNVEDFLSENVNSITLETLQRDIEGAQGWESLEHMFYVLNNTVSYVVLRGLMESSVPPLYVDTDILTTDYENFRTIVNGVPAISNVRPKSEIHIGENMYYIDVWDACRKYYDPLWVNQMLSTAVLRDGMRVLNEENDLYCLLYHCLTNKGYFDEKYTEKFQEYRKKFHIKEDDWAKVLVDWLAKHHYEILEHTDPSAKFSLANPTIRDYALRFGKCIRVVNSSVRDMRTGEQFVWLSKVYRKENSFVKAGSPKIIDNEARMLKAIGDGNHFPKLLATGGDDVEHWVEMSKIEGEELFENRWTIKVGDVRRYAQRILDLIVDLYEHDVLHRDLTTNNILVDKHGNVSLIDFAFAIDFRNDTDYPCPWNLGMEYAPDEMYSDFYNMASVFEYRYGTMPFVKRFAAELKKIDWTHYEDTEFVQAQVELARKDLERRFSIKDFIEFGLGKYRVRKYIKHPKRFLRRVLPTIRKPYDICVKICKKVFRKVKRLLGR